MISLYLLEYLLNILCDKIISIMKVISTLNRKNIINIDCGSLNTKNNIIVIVEINYKMVSIQYKHFYILIFYS